MDCFFWKTFVHYFLHFVFPGFIAFIFYRKEWIKVYGIFIGTMVIDLDHLMATPIFDSTRNSIGFHYFHTYYAIAVYFLLLFFKGNFRIIGLGLLFHIITDYQDFVFWCK
ncbi:DUF6122 family protein [Chryseobacterium sp.]|uniref:DUF6122 family protein n=1 Tax=Chryseobacterium sp. TaxID=1871047 RepID=UPI00388F7358